MRILVVEDDDYKFNRVEDYLKNICDGASIIARAKSVNGALLELRRFNKLGIMYDLVMLDMQLPICEDEFEIEIEKEGGLEVLAEIRRCNYNTKVAICSSEAFTSTEYDGLVIGSIKYDSSVYLLKEFKAIVNEVQIGLMEKTIEKVREALPEEVYVSIWYSFDRPELKKCKNLKEALAYIAADLDDETNIQISNGKTLGTDFVVEDKIEDENFARMTFTNGDVIEWSIPNIL